MTPTHYPAGAGAFLLKNADVRLAVVDAELRVVSANAAWSRMFGAGADRRLESLLPAPVVDTLRPHSCAHRPSAVRSLFPATVDDGAPRWVEAGFRRQGDKTLLTLVDVTDESKQATRIAAARHARDLLLADGGVETWRYDPDADVYAFSPELAADYGLEPPQVPGEVFDSLRHPADVATERAVRERLMRDGGADEITLRVRDIDDSLWRQVRVHMLAGRALASGRFEVFGHTSAVSDIAKARDEARSNTEFLEMALSAAHAGVFEVDHVAQTFRCSPEFINIVGRPLTYEEGRNAAWPELPAEDIAALAQMQGRWGTPGHLSVDVRGGRDGRWIRFYCKVARDESGVGLGAVGLVLDIEDAKRQELALIAAQKAAEAATESKSRFLASVSHEIRTPMNGIVGVLHLLKAENITHEGRGLLEEALACSGMLSQLINDVLDISKIEAGMLELAPAPSRLADAIEGVAGLLAPQAEAKGLYLRTIVEADLGWAMVDDVRLRQCLFNLIGNAVKFTPKGGVEVRAFRAGEGRLRFEIEDTGIGIAPEAHERLFQRFVQADDTTTRNFSGTGLGLTIARSLAQMMGGDISFTSREGEGSTFWMEIAAPTAAPAHAQAASDLSLEGLNILLVDDNSTNRLVGGKILEALGAAVSLSDCGADAVERAGAEAFDLILMDISMPGMDGLEATRRIRALPGEAGVMPIVALTANVMADQQRSYLAAGMNGVVPKPLSPSGLLAEILRLAGADGDAEPKQAAA